MFFDAFLSPAALREEEIAIDSRNLQRPPGDILVMSLQQIALERMNVPPRPKFAVLKTVLGQHDRRDVDIVVAVCKNSIRMMTSSPQWYIHRFHRMVSSVRLIRHVWLASRYRFAKKIHHLVAAWSHDEERVKKGRILRPTTTSSSRQKGTEDDAVNDFLSVATPLELKHKVLLLQYRRLLREWKSKFFVWWKQRRERLQKIRDCDSRIRVQREVALTLLEPLPSPPKNRWYAQLSALTHEQLFELSLRLQHRTARAVQTTASEEEEEADTWVDSSLTTLGMYQKQLRQRELLELPENRRRRRYENITSKLFITSSNALGDESTLSSQERAAQREAQRRRVLSGNLRGTVAELRTMGVVSKFKSQPWHLPPRPARVSIAARANFQRNCNPPTFGQLTPMEQSLVSRGIASAPLLQSRRATNKRTSVMRTVAKEIETLPATQCTVSELLRSKRALEITLNVVSNFDTTTEQEMASSVGQ